jgi:hypothetical protein
MTGTRDREGYQTVLALSLSWIAIGFGQELRRDGTGRLSMWFGRIRLATRVLLRDLC